MAFHIIYDTHYSLFSNGVRTKLHFNTDSMFVVLLPHQTIFVIFSSESLIQVQGQIIKSSMQTKGVIHG